MGTTKLRLYDAVTWTERLEIPGNFSDTRALAFSYDGQFLATSAAERDSYQHFISGLAENLRKIAELHLAGCTHREIAALVGCVERTVERKMVLIHSRWRQMADESMNEMSSDAGSAGTP